MFRNNFSFPILNFLCGLIDNAQDSRGTCMYKREREEVQKLISQSYIKFSSNG